MLKSDGSVLSITCVMVVLADLEETPTLLGGFCPVAVFPFWSFCCQGNSSVFGNSGSPITAQSHCWLVAWLRHAWTAPEHQEPWLGYLWAGHKPLLFWHWCAQLLVPRRAYEMNQPAAVEFTTSRTITQYPAISITQFPTVWVQSICIPCSSLRGVLRMLSLFVFTTRCFLHVSSWLIATRAF